MSEFDLYPDDSVILTIPVSSGEKRTFGRRVEMSAPATKADIEELKRLILSTKPAPQNVNVTFSDRVDTFRRSRNQIAGAL